MALPVANLSQTDTFAGLLIRVNTLAYYMSTFTLTASANAGGSSVSGNSTLIGGFAANAIFTPVLSGGALGNTANLAITSNVNITGISNFTANVNINAPLNVTANVLITATTANITSNTYFSALNSSNTNLTGVTTANLSSLTVNSNTIVYTANTYGITANIVNINGVSTFTSNVNFNSSDIFMAGNLHVSGNLIYTQTSYSSIIPSSNGYALGNTSARWSLFGNTVNLSGRLTLAAGNTTSGTFNIAPGPVPAAPANGNGDFWTTNTAVYVSLNSSIKTLATVDGTVNNAIYLNGVASNGYQTALGYTPVNRAGDIMGGTLYVQMGNSVNGQTFLQYTPTDFGAGKPAMYFAKSATANTYIIGLSDGSTNGVLNFVTSSVTFNGIPFATTSSTVTGALTANNASFLNGQPASYYQNASNINAGTIGSAYLAGTYSISISGGSAGSAALNGQPASYYLNASNFNAGTISDSLLPATMSAKTFSGNISVTGTASVGALSSGTITSSNIIAFTNSVYAIGTGVVSGLYYDANNIAIRGLANSASSIYLQGYGGASTFAIIGPSNANFNVPILQTGNQVWHAGNLNPSIYFPIAGGTITGPLGVNAGLTVGTTISAGGAISTAYNVRSSSVSNGSYSTGNFTAISGSTFGSMYNDGTNLYILKSATSTTAFDSERPFFVNLSTGAVTLDGTGSSGVTTGGQLQVNGALGVNGYASLNSGVGVTGYSSLNGGATANTLTVTNQALISGALTTSGYSSLNGGMSSSTGNFSSTVTVSALTLATRANFAVNNWNISSDGVNRFYFQSGSATILMTGSTYAFWNSGGASIASIDASGNATFNGNITGSASDKRLKTNIKNICHALDKIQKINGVEFDWDINACKTAGFDIAEPHQHGVIAQEILKIIPDAVAPAPFNNDYLTVRPERITPLLIEGIKELQAIVEAQGKLIQQLIAASK